jgi:opacity protein-like surface antigen
MFERSIPSVRSLIAVLACLSTVSVSTVATAEEQPLVATTQIDSLSSDATPDLEVEPMSGAIADHISTASQRLHPIASDFATQRLAPLSQIRIADRSIPLDSPITAAAPATEAPKVMTVHGSHRTTDEYCSCPATEAPKVMTVHEYRSAVLGQQVPANSGATGQTLGSVSSDAAQLGAFSTGSDLAQANLNLAQADQAVTTAPSRNRFYVGGSGAVAWRELAGEDAFTFVNFKTGYNFSAMVGYRFSNFRTEFEASFFDNAAEIVSSAATGALPGIGDISGRAFMFNLYYDFPIQGTRLKPYIGAGLGFLSTKLNGITNAVAESFGLAADGRSNEVFAYQFRGGLSYGFSDSVDVFLGYRYLNGSTLTFTNTDFGTLKPNGVKLHNLELGVRVLF